jgi:aspartate kinase
MKKIVSKFGGTSMADAECMLRSSEVVLRQKSCIVVVSATSGTTNDLIGLAQAANGGAWSECNVIIDQIILRHEKISKDLALKADLKNNLDILFTEMKSLAQGIHLLEDCSTKVMDKMMSFGERMSSILFTQALNNILNQKNENKLAVLFDVREVLKTDDQFGRARPLTHEIIQLCEKNLALQKFEKQIFVTQGFIGQTLDGAITTLGRGGSDYTAAILAEGIQADTLEIWTDVAGIATTDPRITKRAQPISEISFSEASELATFGAKILHPATLLPAMRKNIPVFVGSSFDVTAMGTWVKKEVQLHPSFRAIAIRKKQALITLTTLEMLQSHGFLFRLFEIFNKHKVSIDAVTTSEISVSVTVENDILNFKELFLDLSQFCGVQVEKDLCLVSVIGNNMNHTSGIAEKIFNCITDVNVRMICLGASKHNFCFVVNENDGNSVVQKLHDQLLIQ